MNETRTSTVECLLGLLSLGPMSGYEMRALMERSTANFWSESYGQIYPALKGMLRDGLVEVVAEAEAGERARKVYRLTVEGEERLRSWLGVAVVARPNRNELLLKMFFGSRAERGALRGHVAAWQARYEEDLARYLEIERTLPAVRAGSPGLPYFLMTVRYGIAEARALLGWCGETLRELERLEG